MAKAKQDNETKIPYEELDYEPLTNDLLFHMVFTKNEQALRSLLSCLLDIPQTEMREIEILNPMQYTEAIDTKLTVLDLKLHLNNEKYILIEMQVRRFINWTNRTLAYASRQIADQIRGKEFEYDQIQTVVQIAIMDHTLFPEHKKFMSKYLLRDEEGYIYSDKLEFIVMDLTAVDEASEKEKEQGLVEWADAFRADSWDSAGQIENEGVKEAMKTMSMIMATPSERQLIWDRRMAIWDYNSSMSGARKAGREEGKKVGREEGRKVGREETEALIAKLVSENRIEDIRRSTTDPAFREKLYQELLSEDEN